MFVRFQKRNKKSVLRKQFHTSQLDYNPFTIHDTSYLEHLHHHLKLHNSREALLSLKNKISESNARANYQNELDRLTNEMSRPNLPYSSKEAMEHRINQLKKLIFASNEM